MKLELQLSGRMKPVPEGTTELYAFLAWMTTTAASEPLLNALDLSDITQHQQAFRAVDEWKDRGAAAGPVAQPPLAPSAPPAAAEVPQVIAPPVAPPVSTAAVPAAPPVLSPGAVDWVGMAVRPTTKDYDTHERISIKAQLESSGTEYNKSCGSHTLHQLIVDTLAPAADTIVPPAPPVAPPMAPPAPVAPPAAPVAPPAPPAPPAAPPAPPTRDQVYHIGQGYQSAIGGEAGGAAVHAMLTHFGAVNENGVPEFSRLNPGHYAQFVDALRNDLAARGMTNPNDA